MPHSFLTDDEIREEAEAIEFERANGNVSLVFGILLAAKRALWRHSGFSDQRFIVAYLQLAADLVAGVEIPVDQQAFRIGVPVKFMMQLDAYIVEARTRTKMAVAPIDRGGQEQ